MTVTAPTGPSRPIVCLSAGGHPRPQPLRANARTLL